MANPVVYEYEVEVVEIDPVPSSRGDYRYEATVSRLERVHLSSREMVDPPKHLFWGKDADEAGKKAHRVIQEWIAEQGGVVASYAGLDALRVSAVYLSIGSSGFVYVIVETISPKDRTRGHHVR